MFTNDHDRNISMQQSLHAMTLDDCEATQGLTRNQRTPALGEVQQQKEENTEANSMDAPAMLPGYYMGVNEKMQSMNDETSHTGSSAIASNNETVTTAAPFQVGSGNKTDYQRTELQRNLPPPGPYYDEMDLRRLFGEGYFDHKCPVCWGEPHNSGKGGACLQTCQVCGTRTHRYETCALLYCTLEWHEKKLRSDQKYLIRDCQLRPSKSEMASLLQKNFIDDSDDQILPNYDHPLVTEFYSNRPFPYRLQYGLCPPNIAPGKISKKRKAGDSIARPQGANKGSSSNAVPTMPKAMIMAMTKNQRRAYEMEQLSGEVANLNELIDEKDQKMQRLEMQLILMHKDQAVQNPTSSKANLSLSKVQGKVDGLLKQVGEKNRLLAEKDQTIRNLSAGDYLISKIKLEEKIYSLEKRVFEKDQEIQSLTVDHDMLSRIELQDKVSKLEKLVAEKDYEIAGLKADNDVLRNYEYKPGKRQRF